jgi:hypothetical protein
MFGLTDLRGDEAVRKVDELTGRRPGEAADVQSQMLLLAQEGCRICDISGFDPARLKAERLGYIREIQASFWSEAYETHWTGTRVDEFVELCGVYRDRFDTEFSPFLQQGTVTVERRLPSFAEIGRFVDDGWVVPLLLPDGFTVSSHAVLLYGRDGERFRVYWPDFPNEGSTLRLIHANYLAETWDRLTVTAIAPPLGR